MGLTPELFNLIVLDCGLSVRIFKSSLKLEDRWRIRRVEVCVDVDVKYVSTCVYVHIYT